MSRTAAATLGLSIFTLSIACDRAAPTTPTDVGAAPAPAALIAPAPAPHAGHAGHGSATAASLGPEANKQIAQLRRLMAPFHNFDKAAEFGYSVAIPGPGVCISDPVRGGMGYHYTLANKDLITDGVVNLLEPEFIVYSPQKNGGVRLSAADYFVPYATWTDAEPPSLLGVPFAREDAFQAWVLHIWAFWPNPAGIFENYNPDVPLCPE
jgi:hypothetical protein